MQNYSSNPKQIIRSIWKNRELIKALIKQDVLGKYRGSIAGILWAFFNPMLMLAIYTFVFSVVFKARWSGGSSSQVEFALILFIGLIAFNFFAECINRAPTLILGNVNYVKKVMFPLEILPLVALGSSFIHFTISLIIWLVAYILFIGSPHITIFYYPLVVLSMLMLTLGIMWFLAALGPFLRDITQFMGMLTTMLMFLSPIFYPITALPEKFRIYLKLNPITSIIEYSRDFLYWGYVPTLKGIVLLIIVSTLCLLFGFAWFQKTRKGFADVL